MFIPVSGWTGDRFGTKRAFLFALSVFTVGSFLCGVAWSIECLVAFGSTLGDPASRAGAVSAFHTAFLAAALVAIVAALGALLVDDRLAAATMSRAPTSRLEREVIDLPGASLESAGGSSSR